MLASSYSRVLLPALAACALLAPARALAWTEAHVTAVQARLDATKPDARIELEVVIRVVGGWLSRFEVTGLDDDFALDAAAPPVFEKTSATAPEHYLPAAESPEPGTLAVTFPSRHGAPRRGQYLLRIAYRTRAPFSRARALDARTLRLDFQLPTWDVSLADVRVSVVAPSGARPASVDGDDPLASASIVRDEHGASELLFTRSHLPRSQPFAVGLLAPKAAYPRALADEPRTRAPGSLPVSLPLPLLLLLSVALLGLAKHVLVRRAAARQGLQVTPLLQLPRALPRALPVLSLAVGAGLLFEPEPLLSACLGAVAVGLTLDRGFLRLPLPGDGEFRAATRRDFALHARAHVVRLLQPAAWLDATTPIGALALGLLHAPWLLFATTDGGSAAPASLDAACAAAWLATPLFITATRLSQPASPGRALRRLLALRSTLLTVRTRGGCTPLKTQLVVYETHDGQVLSPRLRISPPRVPAGMGKLEIAIADGSFHGRPTWAFAWVAVTRTASMADALLARALPDASIRPCAHLRDKAAHDLVERTSISLDPGADAPHLVAWLTRELDVDLRRAA